MDIKRILWAGFIILTLTDPVAAKKPELPEWAQTILDSVAQAPAFYTDGYDAEYLLDDLLVRFDEETAVQENTERTIIQVLRAEGVRYGQNLAFRFDNQSSIKSITAWTVKPDGKIVPLKEKDIRKTAVHASYIDYSDAKHKTFSMPEVAQGDIIIYEVKTHRTHPPWSPGFSGQWYIQGGIPTRRARLTLELPSLWSYRYRIYNMEAQSPREETPGTHTWTWDNVPAVDDEPMVRSDLENGYLRYNCLTDDPRWTDRNRSSWDDLAAHYEQLIRGRLTLNEEMKQAVADLTKDCTTDLEKIRAIANYVRRTLTYVAVDIGVGGFQPRHVQRIFQNKYGDCKDMSSLLIGMLDEAGVTAHPVLIRTMDKGAVDPDFPVSSFNHCIAYVPSVAASEPWVETWPVQEVFGRGLWIDPTAETCSIQDMPWTVQGAHALVVTPDRGHLIETPVFGAEHNAEIRSATARLTTNGDLVFEAQERFTGYEDIWYKAELRQGTDQDRLEWMQRVIGDRVPRCTLELFQHSPLNDLDIPVSIRYRFTAKRFASMAGNLTFFRPNVLSVRTGHAFNDEERHYPIFYGYLHTEIDSLTFELPPTYAVDDLPKPVTLETGFGRYQTGYTVRGDTLIYRRHFSITQREIPAEAYAELKSFYQTVVRSDKAQVVLKRKPLTIQP